MCRVFVDKSEDVDINRNGDPSQDRKLLRIFAYARLLRKLFFV